jgi:hypothetical protein
LSVYGYAGERTAANGHFPKILVLAGRTDSTTPELQLF